ncbi:MAG: acetyl-CoA carboxylase biotin carboxyl carrier protein subunit [Bacteriovoracaceae bacterium]|nr:acetyl-CoA carboxylase biotin carboxyl carrier protein subunit [Bacteriovoracaceae bacterium]
MRTYLIDEESNEYVTDLTRTIIHSSELVEYHFSTVKDNKAEHNEIIFVRKLAGQYFASSDNIKWEKVARQELPTRMLNVDTVFDMYYGYKPSGLSGGAAGELKTQMPGKIIKVLVSEGDKVEKGQTLILLEAMKMENEIKSGVDGTVKSIHIKEGDALEQGILMMEVE